MKWKTILTGFGMALIGGLVAVWGYSELDNGQKTVVVQSDSYNPAVRTVGSRALDWENFSNAAEATVNSVVHVETAVEQGYYINPFRGFSFGRESVRPRIVQGSGSGVILSEDGYIVTNHHVIKNARRVQVTTNNNRKFEAEVIGTDPTTDIAVLKVEAEDLTPIPFADSDELRLGQWVLAVGNPFNLNSTVTAGIVSALGRNINIINELSAIESFIQTDAVVNPGNSGGALVDTKGSLVGINTAISTHTGSFEGYSFAVPSNIVRKVVDDLVNYGMVQRAYVGVNIANVTPELKKELNLSNTNGVFIAEVVDGGAAEEAGLSQGDVITRIDNRAVTKTSELMEVLGSKRPGDQVRVTVNRSGRDKEFELTLRNRDGNTNLLTAADLATTENELGGTFESLNEQTRHALGLKNGVVLTDPGDGMLARAGVPAGFIVVKVNNTPVNSQEDIETALGNLKSGDGVLIQGYHPNGRPDYFAFGK